MSDQPISPPPADLLERVERVFMRRVGARIRELRLARGFTQADLHRTHGIPAPYLSKAENGLESLTARTAVRLAAALGVEPYELYMEPSGEEPQPPDRKKRIPSAPPRTVLSQMSNEFRAQIGRRIYELRTLQGMSLDMLAEFTNLDRKHLGLIEAGTTDSAASIVKIADAIGVLPHELYLPRDQSGIREKKGSRRKSPRSD